MRRFTFSSAKRTALTEELEEEDVSGQALRESVCMWLVQVIVHRGEGAGATASSCHDGEALGGLAHCQGQGGAAWADCESLERKRRKRKDVSACLQLIKPRTASETHSVHS